MTLDEIRAMAKSFLALADELNEKVSAYLLDGSDEAEDVAAYYAVKAADRRFVDAVNEFFDDGYKYDGLHYELAESLNY